MSESIMTDGNVLAFKAKAYTLRALTGRDIFRMSKIINKIGIREFKNALSGDVADKFLERMSKKNDPEITSETKEPVEAPDGKEDSGNPVEDQSLIAVGLNVVFEVAGIVFGNLPKCEADIVEFLADLSGMEAEDGPAGVVLT